MRIGWRVAVSLLAVVGIVVGTIVVGLIDATIGRDGAFVIDSFDRAVIIDASGTTVVQETIEVTFDTERRGIFRDLPPERRFDAGGYRVVSVDRGSDDQPWNFAIEPLEDGSTRVRIGEADTWLRPGSYTYRLRYVAPTWSHVQRRDPGTVTTRIDVPGFDWPTSVGATTFTVETPGDIRSAACVQGRRGTTETCNELVILDGSTLRAELGSFDAFRSATIEFRNDTSAFDAGLATYRETPLESGRLIGPFDIPTPLAAVILLALLTIPVVAWDVVLARQVYRDALTDPALHDRAHPTAIPAPPFGMRAPEVAGLLRLTDADALFLATLVDLDQRGVLATASDADGDELRVLPPPPGTEPHRLDALERRFLDALVPDGTTTVFDGEYDSEVARRVTGASSMVTTRAKDVFATHGFEHDRAPRLRELWFRALIAVGYLAYGATVVGIMAWATPLGLPAGLVVIALVLLGRFAAKAPWGHHRLPLNSAGRDAVAQARAFREFIATVEGDELEWAAGQPGIDHLHPAVSVLPYAIALGLADTWYDRFGHVMRELAVAAAGTAAAGTAVGAGASWWTSRSSFDNVRSSQSGTSTAPSSSGGGGGGGSGGGGGGGGSW